jgi:hypothetical protein
LLPSFPQFCSLNTRCNTYYSKTPRDSHGPNISIPSRMTPVTSSNWGYYFRYCELRVDSAIPVIRNVGLGNLIQDQIRLHMPTSASTPLPNTTSGPRKGKPTCGHHVLLLTRGSLQISCAHDTYSGLNLKRRPRYHKGEHSSCKRTFRDKRNDFGCRKTKRILKYVPRRRREKQKTKFSLAIMPPLSDTRVCNMTSISV